jgi:hypothetical protein
MTDIRLGSGMGGARRVAQGDPEPLDMMVECGGVLALEELVTSYGDEWTPFLAPTMAALGSWQV